LKIIKEALAQGLEEFNFGSFELLHIKYGFEVEMGSPVQSPQPTINYNPISL
jgi:hypothetical protein